MTGAASGAELADRVIAAARRQARRQARWRWLAVVGVCGVVALLAVAVPAIADGRTTAAGHAVRHRQLPDANSSRPSTSGADAAPISTAPIYAAALADLGVTGRVDVRVLTCGAGRCSAQPLAPRLRRAVAALGPDLVAAPAGRHRLGDPEVVVFGPLVVIGSRATLTVERFCGVLCGDGRSLELREARGRWTVAAARPDWVSWGGSSGTVSLRRAS